MWNPDFDFDDCSRYVAEIDSDSPLKTDAADRVMKEIQRLYRTKDIGLKDAALALSERNFKLTMPRQKITVLMVGSHNTAKQRLLDLYFSETRQVGGGGFISRVNYDKLDQIYITHGNQRKILTGETVLDYCPHLAQLKDVPGLKEHLTTEISSRNTKSLVSFILAPQNVSFVPSNMRMPINDTVELADEINNNGFAYTPTNKRSFDMRQAIEKLTEAADLIFIFFDPTGTTSPNETLQPFKHLWKTQHEKILLLLARADEEECSEETREEVLTEIVKEVWKNPTVRREGYIPEIYFPDLSSGIRDDERLWSVIQNATDQSVDRALSQLGQDAADIKAKLEAKKKNNDTAKLYKGTPSLIYFWFVVTIILGFGFWYNQFNDLLCETKNQDIAGICRELVANKAFITSIGFIAVYYVVHTLIVDRKPQVLAEEEEAVLNRRIQFAYYALDRKEFMEKSYGSPFENLN